AHHHVPRLSDVREVEDQRRDGEEVVAREQRQREQHDRRCHDPDPPPPVQGHRRPPPMRPWGLASNTRISRPKLTMLLADGAMSTPASASDTPMSSPPSSAPTIEPS